MYARDNNWMQIYYSARATPLIRFTSVVTGKQHEHWSGNFFATSTNMIHQ